MILRLTLTCMSLQWNRQTGEDEQQYFLRAAQHTLAPGPGAVQQPATPAQLDGIALPVGATPISIPGTGVLPPAAGLPLGVLPNGSVAVPAAAEQQFGWHSACPVEQPSAPRPPRPVPRLLPRPGIAGGASAAAHSAGAAGLPAIQPPGVDVAYQGGVADGLLPPLEGADGVASLAFEDQSGAPIAIPGPDGFAAPPGWFAQYGQTAGPPGVVITASRPAGFERARAAHKELRAMRHVIQARPAAQAPQRHALTPRVARPTGLTALESLLRPSRAAELAAEQVLKFSFQSSYLPACAIHSICKPTKQWWCEALTVIACQQASIMDEAAAAARDGTGGDMTGAEAVPSASVENASIMATVGTAPATAAPWQPDETAEHDAFTADIDIGMPESDPSPAAGGKLMAAPAAATVPAGSAKGKGPSRRPTSTHAAPFHDALTSYREQFDKAKCESACSSGF